MNMNNDIVYGVVMLLVLLGLAGIFVFSSRFVSKAVTSIEVVQVEPGVRCAKMITADGVALSCYHQSRKE